MKSIRTILTLAVVVTAMTACEESSGPESGDLRVYMTASSSMQGGAGTTDGTAALIGGVIPLSAVDSINVQLTSIQAFNSSDSAGAVTLALQGEGTTNIDLLTLPGLDADSTLIAAGELPVGTYNNIRLRFSSATITVNETVTVGNATYEPGTHELTIPGGLSSGIKVQGASFTIGEDDEAAVNLTFDPTLSVGTIVATGSNKLMMSPVLHARADVDED